MFFIFKPNTCISMEHRTRAPVRASNFASWNGGQRAPVQCGGYYTRLWDLTYALGLLAPYGALYSLISSQIHSQSTEGAVVNVSRFCMEVSCHGFAAIVCYRLLSFCDRFFAKKMVEKHSFRVLCDQAYLPIDVCTQS